MLRTTTTLGTLLCGVVLEARNPADSQLLLRLRSSRTAIVCSLRFLPQTGRAVWAQLWKWSRPILCAEVAHCAAPALAAADISRLLCFACRGASVSHKSRIYGLKYTPLSCFLRGWSTWISRYHNEFENQQHRFGVFKRAPAAYKSSNSSLTI